MTNDDKFFILIDKIESELKKLETLNDNLSQVDDYVKEVSSIKDNLLKTSKELISEFKVSQSNLDSKIKDFSSVSNSISKSINDLIFELSSFKKNINSRIDILEKSFTSAIQVEFKELKNKFRELMYVFFINLLINLIILIFLLLS